MRTVSLNTDTRRWHAVWRRRMGAVVCLLALFMAVFGHIEQSSAGGAGAEATAFVFDHAHSHAGDEGDTATLHHCVQHGQCSFQAVLGAAAAVDRLGSLRVEMPTNELGTDRAITPWRRPPIVSITL